MQYDNYESKIHKLEKFFKFVFRHLPKIIVSFAIIIATTVTLLATRGIITAEAEEYPAEIVYGDGFEYSAKAFLSKTEYEYCPAGTEEWTKEMPSEAGTYNVRALAKGTFGYKYGSVQTFTIQAKPTEVRITSEAVPYGDEPQVSADLEYEDHISDVTFSYDDNRTVATITSVTVSNSEGKDVTSSYNLVFTSSPITTIARPITIDIADATKIYDGTPLTSNEYVISENTLVEGDRLEVGFDVSLLNVGEVENTATYKIYDKDGKDVSQHYDISTNLGKLTVLPRELSVKTADMIDIIYDAEAHQLKEYAIMGETSLAEGHSSVAENWAQIVNVGTVENVIGDFKIFDADGQDVSANYTIKFEWGKLNVDKRAVTVETVTSDRIYDGTAFSDTSHTATGLVDGHTTVVKSSDSLIDVGSIDNRITVDIMNGDVCVTDNYDITYIYGALIVNKRPITVTTLDRELIYNGAEQSSTEEDVKIDNLAATDSLGFVALTPAKNVGEYVNEATVHIFRNGQGVDQNYEITYQYGTLKISQRTLNVKTESAEFVYDGLAHTYGEFSYSNIVDGHRFNVVSRTSITYVTEGTVENQITEYVIFDSKGEDVTANYNVVFENGTLTVLKRDISFITASAEKMYDGTPLTAPEWEITYNSLAEGDVIFTNAPEGSQTNAGTSDNEYSGEFLIYRDGVDVTANYNILSIEKGTLTVHKRPIMVKTEDLDIVYDGKDHSALNMVAMELEGYYGLCDGHEFYAISYGTFRNVIDGVVNVIECDILCGTERVTDNYIIEYTYGNISIAPRPIIISTNVCDKVYDGKDFHDATIHCDAFDAIKGTGLCEGHIIEALYAPTFRDVIENAENIVDFRIMCGEEEIDLSNYDITYNWGSVNITKRPITISTNSYNAIYDGKYHTDATIFATGDGENSGLCEGHTIEALYAPTFRDVIENAENIVDFRIMCGDEEIDLNNYDITYDWGTVNIAKRQITISTNSYEGVYDGKDHAVYSTDALIVGGMGLCDGHYFDYLSYTEIKNVISDGVNKIEFEIVDEYGAIVDLNNYDITYNWGSVNISKRSLTISTNSYNAVYDGKYHTDPEIFALGNGENTGLCEGHIIEVIYAPSFRDVIENAENIVEFRVVNEYGEEIDLSNYDITYDWGTVNIAKRQISISTNSYEGVYDGKDHAVYSPEALIVGGMGLCDGHYFDYLTYTEIKNVISDGVNKIGFEIVDEYGEIVDLNNYDITYDWGTINITKRPITISTNSYEGVYDGKDHALYSTDALIVGGMGLCEGHYFKPLSYTEIKNVVSGGINEIKFNILDENGEIVDLSNYDITYDWGTINITKRQITISTNSYEGVYDGKDHAVYSPEALIVGGMGLCDGHYFDYLTYTEIKNVISDGVNKIEFKIVDEYGEIIDLNNYDITYDWGTINITKRPMTVTTSSYEGVYDGKDHADRVIIGDNIGLCDGHYFEILEHTEMKNVVSNIQNVIDFNIVTVYGEVIDLENYDITYNWGTINITKRPISIYTNSYEGVYDGNDHSSENGNNIPQVSYTGENEGLCDGHDFDVLKYTEMKNAVSGLENQIDFNIVDEYGKIVDPENYDIVITNGIINIEKRVVRVETGSYTWEYDGKAHTNTDYYFWDDTSFIPEHNVRVKNGSQTYITEIGEVENRFEFVIFDDEMNNLKDNYEIEIIAYGTLRVEPEKEDEQPDNPDQPDMPRPGGLLNLDGMLGAGLADMEGLDTPVFVVTSDYSGNLYLKVKSFGNYNGIGWNDAEDYGSLILDYASAQYLTAFALENYGAPTHYVRIRSLYGEYILPYYSTTDNCDVQYSDTYMTGYAGEEYALCYFAWDYESGITVPEALADFEAKYYEFVRNNYLDIDAETLSVMQSIIAEQGFDPNDPMIIQKVADYIRNAAYYNLGYDRSLDRSDNVVVDFLFNYREGICQHFASSATMLYRALGIPARYTIGYTVFAEENAETQITGSQAHAWVEVYIKGLGWINVEVTGNQDPPPPQDEIFIYPQYQAKEYDGTPLVAEDLIEEYGFLAELLAQGYTYEVDVVGSQLTMGMGTSKIESFRLYDPQGNDVTNRYKIEYVEGCLEVYSPIIKVYIYQKVMEYTSQAFTYDSDEYIVINPLNGIDLNISEIKLSLTDVGYISSWDINMDIERYLTYTAYDSINGIDVTSYVRIEIVNYGTEDYYDVLTVKPRKFVITTDSASKSYDGKPLTKNSFYVSRGYIADGHRVVITITGEQTAKGESENTFITGGWDSFHQGNGNWFVYDAKGNDVTYNYEMEGFVLGKLTVY